MDALPVVWFIAIAVLWGGYILLEGFDLGVGMHMLFSARDEKQRRVMLNAIGPVWDGNEVWLLTAGAATFAAFPVGAWTSIPVTPWDSSDKSMRVKRNDFPVPGGPVMTRTPWLRKSSTAAACSSERPSVVRSAPPTPRAEPCSQASPSVRRSPRRLPW